MSEQSKSLARFFQKLIVAPEAVWQDAEETIRQVSDWLTSSGRMQKEEAISMINQLVERSRAGYFSIESRIDSVIQEQMRRVSLPRVSELRELRQRLNDLIERAEKLELSDSQNGENGEPQ